MTHSEAEIGEVDIVILTLKAQPIQPREENDLTAEPSRYVQSLTEMIGALTSVLVGKGINEQHLHFGGEIPALGRVTVPTDARSEFLANRAMGDWAEVSLFDSIVSNADLELNPVHYGDSDSTSAGEPGFKDQFMLAKEETRQFGKRPDLLLFEADVDVPSDISLMPRKDADDFARRARAAIEVRSSKQQALKYMAVKKATSEETGKAIGKLGLNFTVKIEDLCIVYRWLEVCQIPQIYAQVFFDSVFSINVVEIFRVIASGTGFSIETPAKSQNKSTIMIPITSGKQIGTFSERPTFDVEIHENRTGRIDAYVKPVGGKLDLNASNFLAVLNAV